MKISELHLKILYNYRYGNTEKMALSKVFLKTLLATVHNQYPLVCFKTPQDTVRCFSCYFTYSVIHNYHILPYRTHTAILKNMQEIQKTNLKKHLNLLWKVFKISSLIP